MVRRTDSNLDKMDMKLGLKNYVTVAHNHVTFWVTPPCWWATGKLSWSLPIATWS